MSKIISRASWGAKYQDGYGNRPVGRLSVYGHHSVTGHSGANATYAQDCAAVRTVEQVGQNIYRVGMSYTFLIPPSGRIFQGVSIGRVSAHTINRNTGGAGICFIGNYEREKLTAAQIAATAWLLDHGRRQGWWTVDRFTALHRDVFATACPGKNAVSPLRAVRASAGSPKPATASKGATNDLTGFLRATRDTELRSGPLSTHKKVRDVKEGELLIGSGQDSQWWTGVGDLWVPKSAVEKRSYGGSSKALHHGQWPDRDLPLTDARTSEFFLAWEDLLRRTGDWNDDGVHAAIKRWLRGAWNPSARSGKGYGVGWGKKQTGKYGRGLKRALRDRGFFSGDVTTGALTDELTRAEKAFLNDQRRHLRPTPPSATTHTRGYNGKVH
ncbi:peptidoglycan recognition family protein [uncultured Stenotrophomonas sp.]|uniref:peptidoglycan recognition protein family protein n=1 Tax=uncultured Stenotrophomonas sp. TaxID=165438 RepID=UPI0025EB9104|nr:peptidoglycan recognition family protein [uncultured Stenotrophomonas sp.]